MIFGGDSEIFGGSDSGFDFDFEMNFDFDFGMCFGSVTWDFSCWMWARYVVCAWLEWVKFWRFAVLLVWVYVGLVVG